MFFIDQKVPLGLPIVPVLCKNEARMFDPSMWVP